MLVMALTVSWLVSPEKGKSPVTSVKSITPMAHTSMLGPISFNAPVSVSGAIYLSDPTLILSTFMFKANPAIPKSTILIYFITFKDTRR